MRNFQMRLECKYSGDKNDVSGLDVEHMVGGQWEAFDLGVTSPGFEIFVYAVFTCQHMYMRVNCAERGLILDSARGNILIGADTDWNMNTLQVGFSAILARGQASAEDIEHVIARMKQCPVSRNMRDVPNAESTLTFT